MDTKPRAQIAKEARALEAKVLSLWRKQPKGRKNKSEIGRAVGRSRNQVRRILIKARAIKPAKK